MRETQKPLSHLKRCLVKYPQAQRNLRVREKKPLEQLPDVLKLVEQTESDLAGAGRVLLRYSGTEPKIRLLIEGRDGDRINQQADRIAELIQAQIGE
jgi:phosphoglucosamine mutase